jgi:O-antigen ligase
MVLGLEGLRKGNLNQATGNRWELNLAAWRGWTEYPFTGTGPDSFRLLIRPPARFGRDFEFPENRQQRWCHCLPLQLLLENGAPGGLAWSVAWLFLPLLALVRWRKANGLALLAFLSGLLNLVDCSWLVPGFTFALVLVPILGLAAEAAPDPEAPSAG